jgi:hypothetical protein
MTEPVVWPRYLLSGGNSDLARNREPLVVDGHLLTGRIYVWSIPALIGWIDGKAIRTCPNAGVCGSACYARFGRYRFRNVVAAHTRNLRLTLEHGDEWERRMVDELGMRRYAEAWVRIHDAGDFYSEQYARRWCRIAQARAEIPFYAYTKEVALFRLLMAEGAVPSNLTIIFSTGGRQDHLIDPARDRWADVYPDDESLIAAGAADQGADDRLAAVGPRHVGIVANRIGAARRRAGPRSFAQWQAERTIRSDDESSDTLNA